MSVKVESVTEVLKTGLENVADSVVPGPTPVAPLAGAVDKTVGGLVSDSAWLGSGAVGAAPPPLQAARTRESTPTRTALASALS